MKMASFAQVQGLLAASLLIAGCVTQSPYELSDGYFCGGSYSDAADCIAQKRVLDGSSACVLDNMYVGSAHFAGQEHELAIGDFKRAESGMKEQDNKWSIGRGLTSDYLARTYDETMVNLYQALSYLQQSRIDRARVEFNRVFDRQGRAAQRNSEMIKRTQQELLSAKAGKENRDALSQTRGARCEGMKELQSELATWNAYADYMNPAAIFMCGAFRLLWGEDRSDAERGIVCFKRAYGMHPARVTAKAAEMLDRRASGRQTPADRSYVLVLFENGMGPMKVEERKEIIIPYRYPIYAGIALPMLQHRPQAHAVLSLYDGASCVGRTEPICEFDRVVAAEFGEEFKWLSVKEYTSALIKVGLQIASMEALRISLDEKVRRREMSPLARDVALAAAGATLSAICKATTNADTRMWSTLPHDYQAAIVPRPQSGVLSIRDAGGSAPLGEVRLPADSKAAFVYVKIPTADSPATIFATNAR